MTDDVTITGSTIQTPRLRLRPWVVSDAVAALEIFGDAEVSRWLAPAMDRVAGLDRMRTVLAEWISAPLGPLGLAGRPTGRWVVEEADNGRIVGAGQILPLPPEGDDLELGYQLARRAWGLR